jgi:hypothetical protein
MSKFTAIQWGEPTGPVEDITIRLPYTNEEIEAAIARSEQWRIDELAQIIYEDSYDEVSGTKDDVSDADQR